MKDAEEDKKEIQEVSASLAAAKKISMDGAVVAVLSEMYGFLHERKNRIDDYFPEGRCLEKMLYP